MHLSNESDVCLAQKEMNDGRRVVTSVGASFGFIMSQLVNKVQLTPEMAMETQPAELTNVVDKSSAVFNENQLLVVVAYHHLVP